MPVLWAVDHPTRLVVITAKGVVHLKDMEDCLQGVVMDATLSYRKLFDMTECSPALSGEDIVVFGERVREHTSMRAMGALAIVAASDASYRQAQLFESLAVADRPLKIFRELAAARVWLEAEPTKVLQPPPVKWLA